MLFALFLLRYYQRPSRATSKLQMKPLRDAPPVLSALCKYFRQLRLWAVSWITHEYSLWGESECVQQRCSQLSKSRGEPSAGRASQSKDRRPGQRQEQKLSTWAVSWHCFRPSKVIGLPPVMVNTRQGISKQIFKEILHTCMLIYTFVYIYSEGAQSSSDFMALGNRFISSLYCSRNWWRIRKARVLSTYIKECKTAQCTV